MGMKPISNYWSKHTNPLFRIVFVTGLLVAITGIVYGVSFFACVGTFFAGAGAYLGWEHKGARR
jgi:hypothetical protein